MEDVTKPGIKKTATKEKQKTKQKEGKETEYTMCFRYVMVLVLYVWPSRGAHGQCALFFWSSSCLKSCAPVVIRSTRIGSRVETNALRGSLRVVVHARTTDLFFLHGGLPSAHLQTHTVPTLLSSLNPNSPVKPPGSRHLLPQTIPRVPARLTPSKLRREPAAPHTHIYIPQTTKHRREPSVSVVFVTSSKPRGPPVERTSDIRPASTARPRCAAAAPP